MEPTNRLYYDDSYLTQFTARVVAVGEYRGRPALALDRSAFYPEGGGQPADHGWLTDADSRQRWAVQDVQSDNGVVWHIMSDDEPLPTAGNSVIGQIDWTRRFDHMQQHCGQHILTAAFIATCNAPTVSFHLSERSVTIDLAISTLNDEQAQAAKAWANTAIWQNLPIQARFVTPTELAHIPLRKPPTVNEQVRVVSIGDIDHSACGGTHPARSGEVGAIAILGWSRQRGMIRVEFVCGGRVIAALHERDRAARGAAAVLSVGWTELPQAIARLQETQQALQRELTQTQRELDALRATQWYTQTPPVDGRRIVTVTLPTASIERLRSIAGFIAELPGGIAIVAGGTERVQIVVACAADTGADAREILAAGMSVLGGRGGGQMHLAQGGGGQPAALSAALAAMVERAHRD
ncbi:alanyl-tRNA editing protein [Chloroflexus aggregans]|uniref:Threonyl/alanyl tRNA synthetase SAD n=1 Tax=Chloroflexus aggregans (strain MD-66 / DSM 9485) TaxID=326427 RepID=B8G9Q3_CHLAD|nr:DHHA1 domain-containing protein [Chloroflexus aggregans]ACL26406.1 Threonyl/alanyl tRNA synthetase SAD [Chloroflexus aggregans DSM 9485]